MGAFDIVIVLLTSSVVAGAVSVFLDWVQNRNLERYRSELKLATHDREIRLEKLHEKRAEAIAELYRRLARARLVVRADGVPPHPASTEGMGQEEKAEREITRLREGIEAIRHVENYYEENKLFFNSEQREKMDEILTLVQAAWISMQDTRLLGDKEKSPMQGIRHGNRLINEKVDPLLQDLDNSFQAVLGFDISV